jgi:predicted dehydrogenase
MSAHLADWHPWEAYQSFFMAHAELGGGALLDESHLVDLVYNFFGVPNRVFASVERISPLEIETDDNVDVWMCYEEGPRVWLHLDLYGRPHRREMTIVGEEGTLHWTMDPNRVRFGNATADEWQDAEYSCSRNDMFMAAVQEFLDIVDRRTEPSCTIRDGVQVMRILEAMRSSSRSGSVVVLDQ